MSDWMQTRTNHPYYRDTPAKVALARNNNRYDGKAEKSPHAYRTFHKTSLSLQGKGYIAKGKRVLWTKNGDSQ